MAKKRKQYAPVPTSKKNKSRTEQEHCYPIAKKVLRCFGLEPELIDRFTKKQKQYLLANWCNPPIVKPEKEHTVPRQYIRNIHAEMYQLMKTNFWGNPENQLTYMELATYGFSFLMNISNMYHRDQRLSGTPQEEIARQICEKFDKDDIFYNAFDDVLHNIWYRTRCYSKINYRFYGFKHICENVTLADGSITMRMTILLTAKGCEVKKFIHNNIERKAYRMLITANGNYKPAESTVPRNMIFPDAKEDEKLNIYIQSHVLHRFKERMDLFPPDEQNIYIQYAFTHGLQLVSNGKQQLFACTVRDEYPVGYFTYFIQGNDIVISTFIPLVSETAPEGKKFYELLSLGKSEIIYLGMDKISFFYKVDFEQIPTLKQALIDSGIWQTKLILDEMFEEDEIPLVDANKTKFVKKFINQHREKQNN